MTQNTNTEWHIEPYLGTYELPKLLHEILVKEWDNPLVGDYRGCVVAYVAGGNWDDPDARAVAQANAELIASAPALKAENERLKELLEGIRELAVDGLGEWASVAHTQLPLYLLSLGDIRDAIDEVNS